MHPFSSFPKPEGCEKSINLYLITSALFNGLNTLILQSNHDWITQNVSIYKSFIFLFIIADLQSKKHQRNAKLKYVSPHLLLFAKATWIQNMQKNGIDSFNVIIS